MSKIKEFTPSVSEKLGYYVYLLIDPETDSIFYIGKGNGNRIFAHLNHALSSPLESDKLDKIRSIHAKGLQVKHIIHRHGLTEKEAFEVEAALIDFIGIRDLSNIVHGHHSDFRGRMSISEVIAIYDAPKIEIIEPVILIIANRLFERGMSDERLYEITRGNWVLGERRNKAKFAFCVYNSIVRQIYEIQRWFPVAAQTQEQKTKERWRFDGIVAQDLQHYIGGSVENYITLGAQNPIKYVNC
ncbi:MAG: hypothetical protein JEZ06_12975 [Anaerolineaceae bacterium]|nr:hypothetical protein [Anaerolineaceae bacterium]